MGPYINGIIEYSIYVVMTDFSQLNYKAALHVEATKIVSNIEGKFY